MAVRLSAEREAALVALACKGDQSASATLLDAHEARLKAVASRFVRPGLEAEDLLQAAVLAFLEHLHRYRPGGPARLWTYLQGYVTEAVVEEVGRMGGTMAVPGTTLRHVGRGRRTTDIGAATAAPVSITSGADHDEDPLPGTIREDHLPADTDGTAEPLLRGLDAVDVANALRRLSPIRREVVRRFYGFGGERESYATIAADLGLTPKAVGRHLERARDDLRMILEGVQQ